MKDEIFVSHLIFENCLGCLVHMEGFKWEMSP